MLRDVFSNELFTVLIVIGLICLSVAKVMQGKRFNDLIFVVGNSKYLKIYSRDQKFFDAFDALLFINLVISITIFSFLAIKEINIDIDFSNTLIFKLSIGIAVFLLIKILLERLIGSLFEIDNIIDSYLFQKISYTNFLGILLIPINVLMLYTFNPSTIIIYIAIAIIILINCIGLITSFKMHQSLIKRNFFYFILYLCALEITPYIILYEYIIDI